MTYSPSEDVYVITRLFIFAAGDPVSDGDTSSPLQLLYSKETPDEDVYHLVSTYSRTEPSGYQALKPVTLLQSLTFSHLC